MLTARLEQRVRDLILRNEKDAEDERQRRRQQQQKRDSSSAFLPSAREIKKLCADIESRGFTRADVKECVMDVLSKEEEHGTIKLDLEECFDRLLMRLERNRLPRAFRGGAVAMAAAPSSSTESEQFLVTVEKPKPTLNANDDDDRKATKTTTKTKSTEDKDAERRRKMKEREEMIRAANERRQKKREEQEREEAKAFRAAQMRMVQAASSGSEDETSSSSDSEDSLENFGLSEEEIARKKSHKRNVKMYTENRAGFVSELRVKLKEAKQTAQEEKRKAGKKMDKKRAKELAEEVRKILSIAETFKINENELEGEEKQEKEAEVEAEVEQVEQVEQTRLDTKNEDVKEGTHAKESKKVPNSDDDDDDDDFQILDVFGDDEPEALKLTPEDEAKAKRKNIEASVSIGPVLNVEGTVGAAIPASKNSNKKGGGGAGASACASAALVAPKALLAKMCEKEKWLAPRYDRLKTDDKKTIRYSATIERSSGPKYLRKPTILAQTIAFEEKDGNEPDGGWKSVTEAQDAAACVALFRIVFVEREMKTVVPIELNHQWRDYYRQSLLLRELFSGIDDVDASGNSDEKTQNVGGEDEEDWETFAARARKTLLAARTEQKQNPENELNNTDKASSNNLEAFAPNNSANMSRGEDSHGMKEKEEQKRALSERILQNFNDKKQTPAWKDIEAKRNDLPIAKLKNDFLRALSTKDTVVVCGETGCGKTTQIPQFVLDDEIENLRGANANIICTQPRRVAATSVAERVCFERCEKDGVGGRTSDVGYQVRGDNKTNRSSTKLTFCTVGILLRRLQSDRYLKGVTHVLLDEVHERSLDSDFALALLRDVPERRRRMNLPPLKLVLMSATIDSDLFSRYLDNAPVVTAPGRTFPVSTSFLENIYESLEYVLDPENRACHRPRGFADEAKSAMRAGGGGSDRRRNAQLIDSWGEDAESMFGGEEYPENPDYNAIDAFLEHCSPKTRLSLSRLDEHAIDYDLIEQLLAYLDETEERAGPSNGGGAFLVFLPGKGEVERMVDRLKGSKRFRDAIVLPLHSNVSNRDQKLCFNVNLDSRVRKIVVATNVAETSVTIPDITCVIDSGRVKERRWDPKRGLASLEECFISRASARQRRGRAGRVREGKCFALYTSKRHEVLMKSHQEPEMKRAPLTEVVLQIASLGDGREDRNEAGEEAAEDTDPRAVLSRAPEPPSEESIDRAVDTLVNIGALERRARRRQNGLSIDDGKDDEEAVGWDDEVEENENGDINDAILALTPLGKRLSMLPLDAALAKMLLFAVLLRCLSPALTIAAVVSHKVPWRASDSESDETSAASVMKKNLTKNVKENDSSVAKNEVSDHLVHAAAYEKWSEIGKNNASAQRKFARENGLDHDVLRQLSDLRKQFFDALKAGNVLDGNNSKYDYSSMDNPLSPWNADAKKPKLIKAALVAGLYPNVAYADAVEIGPKNAADKKTIFEWKDSRNADVHPHPSSLVSKISRNPGTKLPPRQFCVYAEKVKTTRTFLRECTKISPIEVLLFAGRKVNVEHEMKRVVLDDWLKVLNVDAVTATLFKKLRVVLDGELAKAHEEEDEDNNERAARTEKNDDNGNDAGTSSSELVFKLVRDILLLEQ